VAANCCVDPEAMLADAGETAIDANVASVMVPEAVATMPPLVAVRVNAPAATACSKPAVVMVATVEGVTDQVTLLLRFLVLPSL